MERLTVMKESIMRYFNTGNAGNLDFTDVDAACNHYKWPLIRFPMERYVHIDYHICGLGFYNVIYEIIKDSEVIF